MPIGVKGVTWLNERVDDSKEQPVSSAKQKSAARRNIKKAAAAATRKKTISHLSAKTRTALGRKGAKAAKRKRAGR
jgi:hypothetical protein